MWRGDRGIAKSEKTGVPTQEEDREKPIKRFAKKFISLLKERKAVDPSASELESNSIDGGLNDAHRTYDTNGEYDALCESMKREVAAYINEEEPTLAVLELAMFRAYHYRSSFIIDSTHRFIVIVKYAPEPGVKTVSLNEKIAAARSTNRRTVWKYLFEIVRHNGQGVILKFEFGEFRMHLAFYPEIFAGTIW